MRDTISTSLAKVTLLPYYKAKFQRFQSALPRARQIDIDRLLHQIEVNRDTKFGRAHNFGRIKSVEAFRDQVPAAEYNDLAPYLDAVAHGETEALFNPAERILAFVCTAGSTGKPKVLPITKTWLRAYQYHWQIWGVKTVLDHTGIMTALWLQISGPAEIDHTPSGLPIGMASAITARYQNPIFQTFFAVPYQVGDIVDGRARNYTILRLAIPQRVGFILTITAANLIRFAELGNEMKQSLIKDIFDGTLTGAGDALRLPEGRIRTMAARRHPQRARELERIVERTGSLYPKDYWPLQVIACWTGGTVGYQARGLPAYYGDVPVRDLGYVSTEGRHTVPVNDFSAAGILMPYGAFYEFVPEGSQTALSASDLTAGETYSVLLTNSQGLYRYRMGDLVQCHGYAGQTPILEFLRKTDQFSDMEGEKVSGNQVAAAMLNCCTQLGLTSSAMSAVPVRPENGAPYYAFLIEAFGPHQRAVETQLVEMLDADLCEQNIMYRQKRADQSLAAAKLWIVAPGIFAAYAQAQGAGRGTGDTQHKQPALLDPLQLDQFKIVRMVEWPTVTRSA